MEVFDKEGVAVRKNRSEGFVMAEVLVTVLFVTVFTSLLFSSGARRYRSALNFAAGTEARLQIENGCFHAFGGGADPCGEYVSGGADRNP